MNYSRFLIGIIYWGKRWQQCSQCSSDCKLMPIELMENEDDDEDDDGFYNYDDSDELKPTCKDCFHHYRYDNVDYCVCDEPNDCKYEGNGNYSNFKLGCRCRPGIPCCCWKECPPKVCERFTEA